MSYIRLSLNDFFILGKNIIELKKIKNKISVIQLNYKGFFFYDKSIKEGKSIIKKKNNIECNKKNTAEGKKKKIKLFISNNKSLGWYKKNLIWHFFFSGFYFDDLFSKFIKVLFNKFMILPSFFILDKWLSYWTGSGVLKQILKTFNKIFYIGKINYFVFLFILVITLPFVLIVIWLFLLFLL